MCAPQARSQPARRGCTAQTREIAMTDLNPQAKQMADESMVQNLDAQARAIWPQETPLFRRYTLPAEPQILDAGCGTGEASWRDGYSEAIGKRSSISRERAIAYFHQMIGNIRDPQGYAAWMIPVVSARVA